MPLGMIQQKLKTNTDDEKDIYMIFLNKLIGGGSGVS